MTLRWFKNLEKLGCCAKQPILFRQEGVFTYFSPSNNESYALFFIISANNFRCIFALLRTKLYPSALQKPIETIRAKSA